MASIASVVRLGCGILACTLACACAEAEPEPPQAPPAPPPAPSAEPAPTPEPYTQGAPGTPQAPPAAGAQPDADPSGQLVYTYPTGQWVYASGHGWMWIPNGTETTDEEGVPYAYLYTPAYGWTWYVSPWGWGGYRYGPWIRHPWHPVGWHGYWVAHPRVVTHLGGRFGGRGHFRR